MRKDRPPYFTTTVETEVDIDPEDLEDAGWVYKGEPDQRPKDSDIIDTVRRYHNDEHPGVWRFCDQRPCIDIRDVYLELGSSVPAELPVRS